MRIEDLPDPRDRAACERAQNNPTVCSLRKKDNAYRRVSEKEIPVPNYDKMTEFEFQHGVPMKLAPTALPNFSAFGVFAGKSDE